MSHRGIRFQRLSSESSHYFWANYLRPRVNKQPASVKTTLCSQLRLWFLSPSLVWCWLKRLSLKGQLTVEVWEKTSTVNCELKDTKCTPSSCTAVLRVDHTQMQIKPHLTLNLKSLFLITFYSALTLCLSAPNLWIYCTCFNLKGCELHYKLRKRWTVLLYTLEVRICWKSVFIKSFWQFLHCVHLKRTVNVLKFGHFYLKKIDPGWIILEYMQPMVWHVKALRQNL